MTRLLKKSKWVAAVLVAMMLLTIMPVSAFAGNGNNTTDITVEKVWEDNNNAAGVRPDSLTVNLYAGEKQIQTITLTNKNVDPEDNNKWVGVFKNVPFCDNNGVFIDYTVEEILPAGYRCTDVVNPVAGGFVKVPHCDTDTYVTNANVVVISTANNAENKDFYVWTAEGQTADLDNLNKAIGLNGGNSLNSKNTGLWKGAGTFEVIEHGSSTPSSITFDSHGNMTFVDNREHGASLWTMFWYGNLGSPAVITNAYDPTIPLPTTGSLEITKNVVEKAVNGVETPLNVTKDYQFKITPPEGVELPTGTTGLLVTGGSTVELTKDYIIVQASLKDVNTATVTVSGLPINSDTTNPYRYVVTEVTGENKSLVNIDGYTFVSVATDLMNSAVVSATDLGSVTITNKYIKDIIPQPTPTGSLEITKNVVEKDNAGKENALAVTKDYYFTITAPKDVVIPVATKLVVTGGDSWISVAEDGRSAIVKVTLTEASTGKVTVSGLPVSEVVYTVNEITDEADRNVTLSGYDFIATSSTISGKAMVAEKEAGQVTIKNAYYPTSIPPIVTPEVGSMKITKQVLWGENKGSATALPGSYTFKITPENGQDMSKVTATDAESWNAETGELKIAAFVGVDGFATLNNLPVGEYTVVELDADVEGYSLVVKSEGSTEVTKDVTKDVTFTNIYSKTSSGGGEEEIPWTPLEPSTPVEEGGGGDNGGNEETITDPDVPLVDVPEEPIEEPTEEIDEPEVPLTEAPGEPAEEITEPEVPLGDAPKTGDTNNAVPFVALLLAAGAGLAITRKRFN